MWEIGPSTIGSESEWRFYNKGGESRCFYFHHHLLIRWHVDGREIKANADLRYGCFSRTIKNEAWFLKPGMSFPLVSKYFCARVLPRGFVFDMHGPSIYAKDETELRFLLGFLNAKSVARYLGFFTDDRSWQVLYVQAIPVPAVAVETRKHLGELGVSGFESQLQIDQSDETSVFFCSSGMCYAAGNLAGVRESRVSRLERLRSRTRNILAEIDRVVADAFGNNPPSAEAEEDFLDRSESEDSEHPFCGPDTDPSFFVGAAFGRWDIRYATGVKAAPELPDPFAPLPVCPPGMLQNAQGLPARPEDVPAAYPLRIPWEGILADDPGFNGGQPHREDIVLRVRDVLDTLWKDEDQAIEQETCEILGVTDLRDYFRKPNAFFQDHLKRYSKSRRKAPIYWPLSTASGSYTIWLYYHRLNDQTLYTVVNRYLEPKIEEVKRGLARIEEQTKTASGAEASRLRDRLNDGRTFLGELQEMREELLRVAALPYKPNLNDGVIINAAPLHKLFRLRSWAADTEECWRKLGKGDYDWAHLAYTIWPDRVREVCRKDRSIAIAHGLEEHLRG